MDYDGLIDIFLYDKLINKYIGQIKIEDTDYVPIDDFIGPDAAMIKLTIPREMLYEFQRINGKKGLPNPTEFWEKSGLARRLRIYELQNVGHENLGDVLNWLDGTHLEARYNELKSSERIGLIVTEIPEEYPEAKELWAYLNAKQ
jgi:hypothetical protein